MLNKRELKKLPSGKCPWCGAYKKNAYGLCLRCCRFPTPDSPAIVSQSGVAVRKAKTEKL